MYAEYGQLDTWPQYIYVFIFQAKVNIFVVLSND